MNMPETAKLLLLVLYGIFPMQAMADDPGYVAQTTIDGSAGSGSQGVVGVNMASGDSNQQSNAHAVTMNSSGAAQAHVHVVQVINGDSVGSPDVAITRIEGDAFINSAGAIGVNQSAGGANAQANGVAIAIGNNADVTSDAVLEQSVSGLPPETLAAHGQQRESTIADTAFNGARGIVQVNQAAGVANATGNSFSMSVHMGGTP